MSELVAWLLTSLIKIDKLISSSARRLMEIVDVCKLRKAEMIRKIALEKEKTFDSL